MKKLIIAWLCLFICAWSSQSWANEIFTDPKSQVSVSLPDGWQKISPSLPEQLLQIETPDHGALITLSAVASLTTPNITEVVNRRKSTLYSTWHMLKMREGNDNENKSSGADRSYILLHEKQLSGTDQPILLAADYILIKGKTSYTISIQTLKSEWKNIESSVRKFRDSFTIGSQKTVPPASTLLPSLPTEIPEVRDTAAPAWSMEKQSPFAILEGPDSQTMFILTPGPTSNITAMDSKLGTTVWSYARPIMGIPVIGETLLAGFAAPPATTLFILDLATGNLLWEPAFPQDQTPVSTHLVVTASEIHCLTQSSTTKGLFLSTFSLATKKVSSQLLSAAFTARNIEFFRVTPYQVIIKTSSNLSDPRFVTTLQGFTINKTK